MTEPRRALARASVLGPFIVHEHLDWERGLEGEYSSLRPTQSFAVILQAEMNASKQGEAVDDDWCVLEHCCEAESSLTQRQALSEVAGVDSVDRLDDEVAHVNALRDPIHLVKRRYGDARQGGRRVRGSVQPLEPLVANVE